MAGSFRRLFTIWRLRNRLLVAYLFIAVVPVGLIVTLAVLGGKALTRQLAVYLVTSELNRRIEALDLLAASLAGSTPAERRLDPAYVVRYPGIAVVIRESGRETRYPRDADAPVPPDAWQTTQGLVERDGHYYLWSHHQTATGDVTVTAPFREELLDRLVPNLGLLSFGELRNGASRMAAAGSLPPSTAPAPLQFFDGEVQWFAAVPASDWERPGNSSTPLLISVRTRPSALSSVMFDPKTDIAQGVLIALLVLLLILFLIVELVAFFIGVRLTRKITGAVHRLYLGTQKAIEGDFSHRIEVKGHDQLADLSHSFNRMTESIEHLLKVAKEKERLQSEMEIASEVQNRLYPSRPLETPSLRVTGSCHPARVVSGDYFDYETLRDAKVLLAIGDVAGKGISAALLMASLQSSLRTQLADASVSASQLVTRINRQLHSSTAPEKFATFCAGMFDESSGVFTYTNAGHLPPFLVRDGSVQTLDVNGIVVGAFPLANYTESCVELKTGDLLVFFTDGVTEPENAYGEMFGEERLAKLISRNVHGSEAQIIETVLQSVREWTTAEELPDDMTLLLARKL
jgi:sigma-B regulation protein RsbU (phosphoserine phosphatase)